MKNKKYLVLLVLLLMISIMSIGYATFSTTLDITGVATINSKWDIKITDIKTISASEGTDPGAPSFSNTSINFNTELIKPGDEVVYQVTIANQGNIDAKWSQILFMSDQNDDNNPIHFETSAINEFLAAGEETTFTITVTYKKNVTNVPDVPTNKLTGIIEYVQII